jgi:adenosylhomocysteine nucleosidase
MEFNAVCRVLLSDNSVSRRSPYRLEQQSQFSHILLVQTGIGPDRARSISQRIVESEAWDVVISSGFAGALNPLPIGSVVIGREVIMSHFSDIISDPEPQRIVCHSDWVNASLNILLIDGPPIRDGRFVTMDRVLTQALLKQRLGKQTGAVAVDMESGAIGQVAEQHHVPFLIIRAISDGVNEDLPVDFNEFLEPSQWAGGVKAVLSTPGCWKNLWQLYRNSKQASEQLSLFFKFFLKSIPRDISSTLAVRSLT